MTTAYAIQGSQRVCAATGRALKPGEKVYTALFDEAGRFERRDFAADAWHGMPEGAFAFWAGRVPALNQKRKLTFDDDLLMECFERLADESEASRIQFRYVLALLLLRRRRLRFDDTVHEDGQDWMKLSDPKTGTTFDVRDPRISETDMESVQEQIFKLLGWE